MIQTTSGLLALVLIATFPAQAFADEASHEAKWSIGGDARFRYETREHVDRQSFVGTRIRLNVDFQPSEQLKAFIQPQFSGVWGQVGSTVAGDGTVAPGAVTSGALLDPTVSLHQGFVLWNMSDPISVQIGRQEIAYGDHVVLGNVGFSNVGRSFDAIRFRWAGAEKWIEPFFAILAEDDVKASGLTGDSFLAGAYGSIQNVGSIAAWDGYLLWFRDNRTGAPPTFNFSTLGTRLSQKSGSFDGRLEANLQLGKHAGNTMRAYMVDLEAGYTLQVLKGLRLGGEYNAASGDDPASSTFTRYHQLFPTAHRWLGYMDLFGRQNIQSGVLHASLRLDDQWTVSSDLHSFWRVEELDVVYSLATEVPFAGQASPLVSQSKHIGEEVDLVLSYKPTKLISLEAMSGLFFPGSYIEGSTGTDLSYFGYLQASFQL